MGMLQIFLTFLVDGLRAALTAALLMGWPVFPGPCGADFKLAVTSTVDVVVVPCGPVEIRFRFEDNGRPPRAANQGDGLMADSPSFGRPGHWTTRFEVRNENVKPSQDD